jgi:hypothetical protein
MDTVSFQYEKLIQELWVKREELGGVVVPGGPRSSLTGTPQDGEGLGKGTKRSLPTAQVRSIYPGCP